MKEKNTPSLKHPEVLFMSLFGIGFLPKMPGTWGSIATLPFLYALSFLKTPFFIFIPIIIITTILSSYMAEYCQRKHNTHDPSWIVMDEVLGMLTAWLFIPESNKPLLPLMVVFILFRFFDIYKIYPANYFDKKVTAGYGIIVDDIISGIYAGIIFLVLHKFNILWFL